MQRKRRSPIFFIGLLLLIIVFCACCIVSIFALFSFANMMDFSTGDNVIRNGNYNEIIAVIKVEGVITSTPASTLFSTESKDMVSVVIDKLDKAEHDKKVKAVILDINSPGGEVYGSDLIAQKVNEVKNSGKPVIALMRDVAASGGYYIAAPATKIVASNSTITGSIGVFLETTDMTGLYDKLGIKSYTVTNSEGDFKHVDPKELGDKDSEAYKIIQGIADDTYDQFVQTIIDGRSMTRDEVVALADGRIYSGKQAKEIGLIDEIGYMDDAIEITKNQAGLDNPKVVEYTNSGGYFSGLDSRISSVIKSLEKVVKVEDTKSNFKVMYLLPY
jgi:protease IV